MNIDNHQRQGVADLVSRQPKAMEIERLLGLRRTGSTVQGVDLLLEAEWFDMAISNHVIEHVGAQT